MNLFAFSLGLSAYYALHSLLAADGPKALLRPLVPDRFYRLCYNGIAASLAAILFIGYLCMEKTRLWSPNPVLPYPGGLLVLAGILWAGKALGSYDLGEFTGLSQWKTGSQPRHGSLIVRGLNAQVRHPLYFGTLLILWGFFLIWPNDAVLVFALLSTAYLVVGSRLEEKKLVAQFGEAYRKYQLEVPMLVPLKRRRLGGASPVKRGATFL